jgi:23S rRNA (cytosine1962-C5)-methyltransferase
MTNDTAVMQVRLKRGREGPVVQGHPWVFSGAVDRVEGPKEAALARVVGADGRHLGTGLWSARSQIRVRMLTGPADRSAGPGPADGEGEGEAAAIDRGFFAARLAEAVRLRETVVPAETTGYRLVNAEGDGLPGWIVDRFGDVLVSQVTAAGLEALRGEAYAALGEAFPEPVIVQSNDVPARRAEGLGRDDEAVRGEPPEHADFTEHGLVFRAEIGGQKTGFYCDQRENRRLAERLAGGRAVLDLFAHAGAFGLYALRGGATRVIHVESSPRQIDHGREHLALNPSLPADRAEWVRANVFEDLRQREERYDLVISDPPPLAKRRGDVDKSARAYKDLNRLAFQRLAPGGHLLTFSCSGLVDTKLFRQVLFAAAGEAGKRVRLLQPLAAAPDHPVAITHPQGEYLKGWWCEVVG